MLQEMTNSIEALSVVRKLIQEVEKEHKIKCAKLTDAAILPTKTSPNSAGYELYSAYNCLIPALSSLVIYTDLQLQFPPGHYGRIAPRSGLSLLTSAEVGSAVVDADHQGNVGVHLTNKSHKIYRIARGDKIAQIICEKICQAELEICDKILPIKEGVSREFKPIKTPFPPPPSLDLFKAPPPGFSPIVGSRFKGPSAFKKWESK